MSTRLVLLVLPNLLSFFFTLIDIIARYKSPPAHPFLFRFYFIFPTAELPTTPEILFALVINQIGYTS